MKTLFRLIVLVLLVTGWGLSALSLHIVRTGKDRVVIIPKQRLGLSDTYVDARAWTIDDATNHLALMERVIQSGQAEQFTYLVKDDGSDAAQQLEDALRNAPRPAKHEEKASKRGGNRAALNNVRSHAKVATAWWDLGG